MGAYISLAALALQMVFLAIALSFAGYGMNKIINRVLASRTEQRLKSHALVAASRAKARAHARAHSQANTLSF